VDGGGHTERTTVDSKDADKLRLTLSLGEQRSGSSVAPAVSALVEEIVSHQLAKLPSQPTEITSLMYEHFFSREERLSTYCTVVTLETRTRTTATTCKSRHSRKYHV
jgi:hypothetical protein